MGRESNLMFTYIKKRNTSSYYEFQYCKEDQPPEILVTPEYYGKHHFLPDSLLIYIDDDERFFPLYIDYLTPTHSPDGLGRFLSYGVNYYDREQTENMIKRISEDKPLQYKILVDWLEKAAHEYNGFYFLGL
jgi:hypothetical protein